MMEARPTCGRLPAQAAVPAEDDSKKCARCKRPVLEKDAARVVGRGWLCDACWREITQEPLRKES